jgi:hypothetical protein
MSDDESSLNHNLYLQETIRTECKALLEDQVAVDDHKAHAERQNLLNSLYIQYMDLSLKATGLLAAEKQQKETTVEFSTRTPSDEPIERTASGGNDAPAEESSDN